MIRSSFGCPGWSLLCCLLGLVAACSVGCQPPATVEPENAHEHEHEHGHAESYAAALAELQELHDTIQNAFNSGNPADADEPLHEVAHLLEQLPELAQDAGLSEEESNEVKSSSDRVFEAYDELHAPVHRGDEIEEGLYEGVAETIDSGIAELEDKLALVEGADSSQVEVDHNHEGDADHAHEGEAADHDHEGDQPADDE